MSIDKCCKKCKNGKPFKKGANEVHCKILNKLIKDPNYSCKEFKKR